MKKFRVQSLKFKALKGRQAIAQGNALWLNAPTNPIAPRSIVVQGGTIAWGKINDTHLSDKRNEGNIQYSIINIQCRSIKKLEDRSQKSEVERKLQFSENALKSLSRFVGRQNISARDNALGLGATQISLPHVHLLIMAMKLHGTK